MISEAGRGGRLIIEGINEDGTAFRPSDWAERLAALSARFGADHRLHYSWAVQPGTTDRARCLVIDHLLQASDPDAYAYIMKFAQDNHLKVRVEGVEEPAAGAPAPRLPTTETAS